MLTLVVHILTTVLYSAELILQCIADNKLQNFVFIVRCHISCFLAFALYQFIRAKLPRVESNKDIYHFQVGRLCEEKRRRVERVGEKGGKIGKTRSESGGI